LVQRGKGGDMMQGKGGVDERKPKKKKVWGGNLPMIRNRRPGGEGVTTFEQKTQEKGERHEKARMLGRVKGVFGGALLRKKEQKPWNLDGRNVERKPLGPKPGQKDAPAEKGPKAGRATWGEREKCDFASR